MYLYRCNNHELPTTQYGIFTDLVRHCIHRHQRKEIEQASDGQNDNVQVPKSLDDLSGDTKHQFQEICKIAYNGIMKDQVVFNEVPLGFNTLGLLQDVESIERSKSFHFHHLSIQELLAAIYLADLNNFNETEQREQFEQLFGQPRFAAVFQFFAAKTKLSNPEIVTVVKKVARSKHKALLLSLIHCLYEAQDRGLRVVVSDELKSTLDLSDTRLNATDCYSLGDFLRRCEDFTVNLSRCSIDYEGCKALFRQENDYHLAIQHLE